MTTVTVKEQALRELVREALGAAHLGDLTIPEEPEMPINVNPVVDPSAAETDFNNPCYVPQSKPEFDVAVRNLVKDVPISKVPGVYKALEAVIDADQDISMEDDEMKKAKQGGTDQVEESLRKAVRRMLSEITPRFDMSYSGTEYGDSDDDDDDLDDKPKRAYKTTAIGGMHDVGGASFQEIAKELGLSVAGAKRAVDMALDKARFVATGIDDDDRDILVLSAMNDYIKVLAKKGDLSPADVQLMKDHPSIVQDLDGFREFLHGAIKRARKGGKLEDPLGEGVEPGDELTMKSVKGRQEEPKSPSGNKTTKAKGASGKDIEVDWGGFNEMDEAEGAEPPPGPHDDDPEYHKWSQQGPPCPQCGSDDTRPVDSPSMMGGEDFGVTCLDCQKTSWADPFSGGFKGPHANKSEGYVAEAKKHIAKNASKKLTDKQKKAGYGDEFKPSSRFNKDGSAKIFHPAKKAKKPDDFTKRMDALDAKNYKKYGSPSGWGKKDKG